MPKTVNNLWDQIIDFENLYQAYKEATQGKRYRRSCIEFSSNLEENLITLQNDLIWDTYVPGAPRCFYVMEPKKRMISAPPFRDRVVHHALVRVIEPIIDSRFIYESHACRKGHGVQMAVARLQRMVRKAKRRGAYWHYKGDIKGYFPSIDLDLLKQHIRRIIACKRTLALADTMLGSGKGLPIGALTSQLFANLYLDKLDHYAKDVLGLSYIRYMDDFIILDNDKQRLKENANKVCRFVSQELNLQMNRKSGIAKTLVHFCGFRVRATHVLPRKATVRRASRRLRKLAKCGDLARIRASIMSFLGYMKHCSTYRTTATILNRTIIRGGKS
jgi:retron-type reverse transcriptase